MGDTRLPRTFYSTVHIPRAGLAVEFLLLVVIAGTLTSLLPPVAHWTTLIAAVAAVGLLVWRQERTMCFPRLEVTADELRYRDAAGAVTVATADVARISGGERLAVTLSDGARVEFPAISATQLDVARGHDTYPDRVARELGDLMPGRRSHADWKVEVVVDTPNVSDDRRKSAVVAMVSMAAAWALVILVEILRR